VGQAHNIAFATLPNIQYPSDIFPSRRFYADDLGEPGLELSGPSEMTAPPGPGIGCEPHTGRLQRCMLEQALVG
jgi:O-succinylbenzoate synthase